LAVVVVRAGDAMVADRRRWWAVAGDRNGAGALLGPRVLAEIDPGMRVEHDGWSRRTRARF
jgi:hypothetical protein